MTEVFYADVMEHLSLEDCNKIKRASEKHITALAMDPVGELFVDNYRALHGRDVWFIVVYMLDRRMGDRTRRRMERCNGELCSRRK